MNLAWRKAVLETSLPASVKLTAFALDSFANRDGYACPSIRTLGKLASLDPKTISAGIDRLEHVRLLTVERARPGHKVNEFGTNNYWCQLSTVGAIPTVLSEQLPQHLSEAVSESTAVSRGNGVGATPTEPVRTGSTTGRTGSAARQHEDLEPAEPEPRLEPPAPLGDGEYTRLAIGRGLLKDMP